MKKYGITLLILIILGVLLATYFITQDTRLDKDVFIETTESIRSLQAADKNLLLLIYKSLYNSEFDNDELLDINNEISKEFDELKSKTLESEIAQSNDLRLTIENFDQSFSQRKDILLDYIDSNIAVSNALISISVLNYQLKNQTKANTDSNKVSEQSIKFKDLLGKINALTFDAVIGEELEREALTTDRNEFAELSKSIEFKSQEEAQSLINQFIKGIDAILLNYAPHKKQFAELDSLKTTELLNSIENEYTNYHNKAITVSNQFRNALLVYGACLLLALLFFAWRIRKNYLSLGQQVTERTKEINKAYIDLKESQEQLIQSEKMASLGQMVAGVAHEINTPLGYVTSNVDILKINFEDIKTVIDKLGDTTTEIRKKERDNKAISKTLNTTIKTYEELDANVIAEENIQLLNDGAYGLAEISKLVTGLKDFARLDRQNSEQIDVHTCINSSVTIASNHIKDNNVNVILEYGEIPTISCFPSKLNQLFLNIITNACQAMKENGGNLTIKTSNDEQNINISFSDQGCGMDEDTKHKMFDPFFTTKDVGEGTGLGMSISYKIIEAHNGNISVNSITGTGTVIDIQLPLNEKK